MISRRDLCKTIAAGVAGTAAVGASASSVAAAKRAGTVSTRGQFTVDGALRNVSVSRTAEYEPLGYDVLGDVPGLGDDEKPDDLVVFAHGFAHSPRLAQKVFGAATKSLSAYRVDAPVVGFSWDSDWPSEQYLGAAAIARANGRKLAAFLADYAEDSPDTRLHLIGHSLGGQVAFSTARALHGSPLNAKLATMSLLGAAVDDEAPSYEPSREREDLIEGDETYGPSLRSTVGEVHNFHKRDDQTLDSDVPGAQDYVFAERDRALGEVGSTGQVPHNFTDHDVTDVVNDHNSYFLPNRNGGCMRNVAANL